MSRTLIGEGILTWRRHERQTDRYGAVALLDPNSRDEKSARLATAWMERQHGRLIAEVTGLVDYTPSTKKMRVGDETVLGEGHVFVEHDNYGPTVGLCPVDLRESHWLNPDALYSVDHQQVRLYFEPA